YLEKAIKSDDLETARRAERIKAEIVRAAEVRRKELLSGRLTRAVKPSFAFLPRGEELEGEKVTLVAVKLPKKDAAYAPQLARLGKLRPGEALSSVALTVEPDRLQVDVWLPSSEFKVVSKAARR